MPMKRILANSEAVAGWLAERCMFFRITTPYVAIGLLDDAGQLVAGVVYDNFIRYSIDAHVAAEGKPWTRFFLRECFRYPFGQLGVRRITAKVASWNLASQEFVERLGFQHEGTVRELMPDGSDCLVYGMLRRECRWISEECRNV
jgi:RimJ/RimL family protein N-acetyltransferase